VALHLPSAPDDSCPLLLLPLLMCVCALPGGPKAMCMGCASFAAFSFAIDHFMEGF
jgi:hypothetical protein